MQVFRDNIKDVFGLTDNFEVARDDVKNVELEVPEDKDGDRDGAGPRDIETNEEPKDFDSMVGEDDDLHNLKDNNKDDNEDDGDLDGLVHKLSYDAF